jgi:hypothetical protein
MAQHGERAAILGGCGAYESGKGSGKKHVDEVELQ